MPIIAFSAFLDEFNKHSKFPLDKFIVWVKLLFQFHQKQHKQRAFGELCYPILSKKVTNP